MLGIKSKALPHLTSSFLKLNLSNYETKSSENVSNVSLAVFFFLPFLKLKPYVRYFSKLSQNVLTTVQNSQIWNLWFHVLSSYNSTLFLNLILAYNTCIFNQQRMRIYKFTKYLDRLLCKIFQNFFPRSSSE